MGGFEFRAAGRQPIDLGWRAAFPEWQPADEKGDEAQLLPPLRNGETALLQDPKIEDKETRPPPRYNEGTLIEAMQNAWRFVDDEVLRERLKEAKGIGTPATRAEIIGGLKKQNFLMAQGKHIVPTETGLSLFGVLKQADPALVDPGVTAQLECLLDDVVVGKQEMVGAIDAVCDVAQRIIGKLKDGAAVGGLPSFAGSAGPAAAYPPTPAMKRFADSIVRQKGIKPPPGYKTSISICRKFLNEHAPKKTDGETAGKHEPNSCHAATQVVGPREGLSVFATPHSVAIMNKYRALGHKRMPIAFVFGIHPAYEVMANYSGLHMDCWGELEMVGTIMDRDVEVVPCETIDLSVPAHAEIVPEGWVNLDDWHEVGSATAPSMYALPRRDKLPMVEITALTMRADRPIYRNHQTVPDTDHQTLPRLCHEAVLYNRLSEMGLDVKDVRFPPWGGALSCLIQFDYPRDGFVNDALMLVMGSPWLNTKMVVALSPDTNLDDPGDVYHAIASRCDPARDILVVPGTRGSPYDPAATPIPGQEFWRTVGKAGIDATIKSRHDLKDFQRAWPKNWGRVKLSDYLG